MPETRYLSFRYLVFRIWDSGFEIQALVSSLQSLSTSAIRRMPDKPEMRPQSENPKSRKLEAGNQKPKDRDLGQLQKAGKLFLKTAKLVSKPANQG